MQYVRETSRRLNLLLELNSRYYLMFNDCSSEFKKECCLNSKQQFDTFNYKKIFNQTIENHLQTFEDIVRQVNVNIDVYDHYLNEQLAIYNETLVPNTLPRVFKDPQQYLQIEYQMLESYALRPVTDVTFELSWFYTSPQGRNHYHGQYVFDLPDIEASINTAYELAEIRESKQYQRSRLTPSLRFEILKRDGYRCCLCGRSAADGAELEVDHKVPISKGGKTEPANLWTLCWDCNRGKSDKDL